MNEQPLAEDQLENVEIDSNGANIDNDEKYSPTKSSKDEHSQEQS